jgi:2-pyrone-4,6-dicarboxylate lactonase
MTQRAFTVDEEWLSFVPNPSKPTFALPDGAVDAHCHVFGPGNVFPFAPERKYTPCDASKTELFALRDLLGCDKNVVVQATCHGSDNSAMIDALRAAGDRARGVATVRPDVSNDVLAQMHEAGVRGVRFNFIRRLVDPKPDAYYNDIIDRIAPLGWHVVVYFEAADLAERWSFLTALKTTVVIDHMGRPDVTKPVEGQEFSEFLCLIDEYENFLVKVACPERFSVSGPPDYEDVVPFARRVIEEFPDRVLWGTDWPHPKLVDFIPRIAVTPELQRKLLVDNPTRIYWEDSR